MGRLFLSDIVIEVGVVGVYLEVFVLTCWLCRYGFVIISFIWWRRFGSSLFGFYCIFGFFFRASWSGSCCRLILFWRFSGMLRS